METQTPHISVVLTAHRERAIVGPTVQSALSAVRFCRQAGLRCEILVVMDRSDQITSSILHSSFGPKARYLETDEGDPGIARNRGIEVAQGLCSAFLDGDDLWSENWLLEAWRLIEKRPDVVAHSYCNIVFGQRRRLWWHCDSESDFVDPNYLLRLNFWDALSFARTDIYRQFPFRRNDLGLGFGHEDWHWSTWTLREGVHHKPVPNTVHFKRARPGSQMSKVDRVGATRWPVPLFRN